MNEIQQSNFCPYCDYKCDAAMFPGDENKRPNIGDLSFCLMCYQAQQFDKKMKLVKFDINSIKNIIARNKLKCMQLEIQRFWEEQSHEPEMIKLRNKYLKQAGL